VTFPPKKAQPRLLTDGYYQRHYVSGFPPADLVDTTIFQADIGFVNSGMINNQRIRYHCINGALRTRGLACPIPSRMTLPPPTF
jgi:hypothetical protein